MRAAFRAVIRSGAFIRKEATEVLRQPRLLVLLVIGPFLVLLLFGAGLRDVDPPVRTLFVAPEGSEITQTVDEFAASQADRLIVEGVGTDLDRALARLDRGDVELVVAFPDEVTETVRRNQQAVITLYHGQIDPVEGRAIELFMQSAVDQANRQVLAEAMGEAQDESEELHGRVASARERATALRVAMQRDDERVAAAAGPALVLAGAGGGDAADLEERLAALADRSAQLEDQDSDDLTVAEVEDLEEELAELEGVLAEFRGLTPEIMAAPFRGEAIRVAADGVELGDFYAPAVAVVLLQHLLVTALGLSLVREQELGTTELYRVAPLRAGEIVVGKYVAHLLVAGVVGAALLSLLVFVLDVPMRGDPAWLVASVAGVCLASAGLGMLVSLAARTDTQAVQYAMLLLLLTVFFSGFILGLDRFFPEVRWVAWLVPATYGIALLRDVMLRGTPADPLLLAAVVAIGVGLGLISWAWLRRRLRTG